MGGLCAGDPCLRRIFYPDGIDRIQRVNHESKLVGKVRDDCRCAYAGTATAAIAKCDNYLVSPDEVSFPHCDDNSAPVGSGSCVPWIPVRGDPGIAVRTHRHITGSPGVVKLKPAPIRDGIEQQENAPAVIHTEPSDMVDKFPCAPCAGCYVFLFQQASVSIQVPVVFFTLRSQVEFKFFTRRLSRDCVCMHRGGQDGKQDGQGFNDYAQKNIEIFTR